MERCGSKLGEAAKLTLVGTVFVGLGAVLSVYVPCLHKPTDTIQQSIRSANTHLSRFPVAGELFKDNPITNNDTMTRFLAVNILESFLIAGLMVGTGAVMKLCGVLPHHLEEKCAGSKPGPETVRLSARQVTIYFCSDNWLKISPERNDLLQGILRIPCRRKA